ncbi:MAG: VWA domain-containing protein [Armatimonadetes bacterium]|nr:VWA domain-containing protein [Armatimonadota bacterium]
MALTSPGWLLLLVPLLGWTWWVLRRARGMSKVQRILALAIRSLILIALVVALAGPEMRLRNQGLAVAFVLDASDSIPGADRTRAQEFINQAMQQLGDDDLGSVVAFGQQPLMENSAARARPVGAIQSKVDPSGSNLAAALRLGIASLPSDRNRRIVLLSDGNETEGDLLQAAEIAATEGVTIDIVPLGTETARPEAYVADLQTPSDARVGAKALIRTRVVANKPMSAELSLDRDGLIRTKKRVQLNPGENVIVFEEPVEREGLGRYHVSMTAEGDTDQRNNSGLAVLSAKGPSRVMLVEATPAATPLFGALQARGLNVSRFTPMTMPIRPMELALFDAIIFNDVNAALITEPQMRMIQGAIRDSGTGFIMVGGENSFLPGGYYNTPIAEALPVDLNIRQRKDLPSTSILIMVDCSGSMGMIEDGLPKLELAKKAAESTALLLGPTDRLAVAGSSDGIEYVQPFGLMDKTKAIENIRRLAVTGGGIYIGPSVESAQAELAKEPSKIRHLILLADGADSTDWRDSMSRVAQMRKDGITTSVVAFGQGEYCRDLQRLAAIGGGRYYLALKSKQLPAIFSQDAAIISRSAIEEGAFYPKLTATDDAVRGLDALPPLLAYCLTDSRPLATTILRTHKDDPLLARWQYGLGTSMAFTSDAQSRWAAKWTGWEGFDVFWSQTVRSLSRRAMQSRYEVNLEQQGGDVVVDVGTVGDQVPSSVRVTLPSGEGKVLPLEPVAPGKYRAKFKNVGIGTTIVSVVEDSPTGALVQVESVSRAYPAEYQSVAANLGLLNQVAKVSGGRVLKNEAELFRPGGKPVVTSLEVWFQCLLLAAILWPIDVAVRRLVLRRRTRRPRVRAEAAPVPISRLQEAKKRGQVDAPRVRLPEVSLTARPEKPVVEVPPPPSDETTAERLLELKRKRREGKE